MGLETGSFIFDLVITNPTGDDGKNQGDDHIRLIKSILRSQFPNFVAAAMNATVAELNFSVGLSASITSLLALKLDVADVVAGTGEVPRNAEGLMTDLHADIWDGANLLVALIPPTTEGVDGDIYFEREA